MFAYYHQYKTILSFFVKHSCSKKYITYHRLWNYHMWVRKSIDKIANKCLHDAYATAVFMKRTSNKLMQRVYTVQWLWWIIKVSYYKGLRLLNEWEFFFLLKAQHLFPVAWLVIFPRFLFVVQDLKLLRPQFLRFQRLIELIWKKDQNSKYILLLIYFGENFKC